MASNIQETISVMQELQRVFSTHDDANTISEIIKKRGEIDKLMQKKQADAKKLIKELTTRTQQLEVEVGRREAPDSHRARVEMLERQKENITNNIAEGEKQNQQLKQEVERLKKKTDELRLQKKQLDEKRSEDGPRLKLYQCISNIKWDYDSPRIKGHVDVVDFKRQLVKDVRPFDIDTTQHTTFEITNMLWDLMD